MESKFDASAVIDAGHPPVASGVVCVDWDGVVQPFGKLFDAYTVHESAVLAIRKLKAAGYRVVIFTSRLSRTWHEHEGWNHEAASVEQYNHIVNVANLFDIPIDGITSEKIPAVAYFDDKAWRVKNNDLLAAVRASGILGDKDGNE